jgi:GT2 family glycosyltransferase
MIALSVVINTKDRADVLRLCLGALQAQTLAPERWEIVVVDDGSQDDGTARAVGAYRGAAPCRLVRRDHGGCAAARNTGIDAAVGRCVLFLGDDVFAEPNLLEEHLAAHDQRPQTAVVGPYERDGAGLSALLAEYVDTCRFRRIRDPDNASWRFFYTGNASVERETLLRAGGFDENFVGYAWEDMDLGVRLEKIGCRIVYHPPARATHHHPGVSLESLCRVEFEQSCSAWYFFEKWKDDPGVRAERFWTEDPARVRTAPPWRKALGRVLIRAAEGLCPLPPLLRALYERLIWSYRYDGLRAGAAHYGPLLERWRAGRIPPDDLARRFQLAPAPRS